MEEFKKELKELLKKYGAHIGFSCSEYSDTYGLYDDTMYIAIGEKSEDIDGWIIDSSDL